MEDVELNFRINKVGFKRLFVVDAAVFHPWRIRKGLDFVKVHSWSVAKFVRLHPDQASNFSLFSQFKKFLRSLKQNLCHAILTGHFNGLARQIFLDSYSIAMSWIVVKKLEKSLR